LWSENNGLNSNELKGYKGSTYELLKQIDVSIGDMIEITKNNEIYLGGLMPRSESGDDQHIVIKIKSGYNIGVKIDSTTKIAKIGAGAKPTFIRPPSPDHKEDLAKVDIISTGGTIASRVDYRTGAVQPALSAADLYSSIPELSNIANINAHILYSELSENISPHHWIGMAEKISEVLKSGTDGIVICHGTDTMSYSAAALSFALRNLPVPVIMVGSQRSSDRPSSDAATNLMAAVAIASKAPFAEVTVAMHGKSSDDDILVHKATKVRKCHTSGRFAFKSINASPIATYDIQTSSLKMNWNQYQKRDSNKNLNLEAKFNDNVLLLKSYPGMKSELIEWAVENYSGIVLEGTGLGHVSQNLLNAIKNGIEKGVLFCMTSQCIWGRINMNVYTTGRDLLRLGVLPLKDMLPETALVKMMWTLGQTTKLEDAKKIMITNIAGEISPRTLPEDVCQ